MTVTNTNTSRLRSGRGASLLAKEHTVLSHICRVPDREGGGNHTLALAYGMEIWKPMGHPVSAGIAKVKASKRVHCVLLQTKKTFFYKAF